MGQNFKMSLVVTTPGKALNSNFDVYEFDQEKIGKNLNFKMESMNGYNKGGKTQENEPDFENLGKRKPFGQVNDSRVNSSTKARRYK